jgi:hypothetical protein
LLDNDKSVAESLAGARVAAGLAVAAEASVWLAWVGVSGSQMARISS